MLTSGDRVLLFCLPLILPLRALAEKLSGGHAMVGRYQRLANDNMEGRLTGSPGYKRAADYVISRLRPKVCNPRA